LMSLSCQKTYILALVIHLWILLEVGSNKCSTINIYFFREYIFIDEHNEHDGRPGPQASGKF